MAYELIAFKAEHAIRLVREDGLTQLNGKGDIWDKIEHDGAALSGLWNGSLVICGGLIPLWSGRAVLWSILSRHSGPAMRWIHRETLRYLEEGQRSYRRLELTVSSKFVAGHKWAQMLGFKPEGLLHKYGPDGSDHVMYARVV